MTAWLEDPRLRAALAALWCIGWVLVALASLKPMYVDLPSGSDKLVHFGVYAVMVVSAATFCRRAGPLFVLVLLAIAIGGLIEIAQGLVPHRSLSLGDAVANALGALFGYGVALIALALWHRLRTNGTRIDGRDGSIRGSA